MGLIRLFRSLTGIAPPAPIETRLTEVQVLGLAKQAAGEHPMAKFLRIATPRREPSGRVVWLVQTGGVGAFLHFEIDDASGAVLDRREYHGR